MFLCLSCNWSHFVSFFLVSGLGKGVGKGAVGIVIKPVVGILDASSQIANGIKNALKHETVRVRRPRQFDQTGIVRPFNESLAEAQQVLRTIDNSIHGRAIAVFLYPELGCVENDEKDHDFERQWHVLITSKAVFYLKGREMYHLKINWIMPLSDIGSCVLEGCNIKVRQAGARDVVRIIKMHHMEEAHFVMRKIERALQAHNNMESNSLKPTVDVSLLNLLEKLNERQDSDVELLGAAGTAYTARAATKNTVDLKVEKLKK